MLKLLIVDRANTHEVNVEHWELLKEEIKMCAIGLCQKKSIEKKAAKIKQLLKTLHTLIREENITPGLFTADIQECKAQLMEQPEEEY